MAVLSTKADLLLLAEPTNDLDLAGLGRLERYLTGVKGTVLERTANSEVEIDAH